MKIIANQTILIKRGNIYDLYKNGKLYASTKPKNNILTLSIEGLNIEEDGIYIVNIKEKTKDIILNNPLLDDDTEFEVFESPKLSDIIFIEQETWNN